MNVTRTADRADDTSVTVSVLIAAEPETVWRFLSDGDRFGAWIGAFAGQPPLPGTAVEPHVGGTIRVSYPTAEPGKTTAARGEITAMEPLKRVAFSWGYEAGTHGLKPGASQVEITLHPEAGGTRVCLRHTGLPGREAAQGHFSGWKHYLAMLARQASETQQAESLPGVIDTYFRAWREADDAVRRQLLDASCEPDVSIRSFWACTDGVDELSAHIANGLRQMPGMTLRQEGPAQHLHGYARVGWAVQTPDDKRVMGGTNMLRLSPRGRIALAVSFAEASA
jgi:uncharacterized protein YndB with AHSA1/START domain